MDLSLNVIYELPIDKFVLRLTDGREFYYPETLSNGRVNYVLFEHLVREFTSLHKSSKSDHVDPASIEIYEQKAYTDPSADLANKKDLISVSSSNTFQANKYGKLITNLLKMGNVEEAEKLIYTHGYSKNDFYVLTNTANYAPSYPFRFFIVTTAELITCLDEQDPRFASRAKLLNNILRTEAL